MLGWADDVRRLQVWANAVETTKSLDRKDNRTHVVIQLDNKFSPLRSNARAILRQKTLLGETYVELTPGDSSAPFLKEGALLPNAQVANSPSLDQIFQAFDPKTRQAFRDVMH